MASHSENRSSGSAADVRINGDVFRLNETIYKSAECRIFSAQSLQSGGDSAFVIKCCRCGRGSDVWQKTMREIEAGTMLRHCPHIVRLLGYSVLTDARQTEYQIFLLFDRLRCLDGMDIHDARGVLEICHDVSRALEFMRQKGLTHGDVKPRNIYSDGEKWRLGDLGSVCVRGEIPRYGSEGYCSPEAMRGEPCDIRADLYSLGISLYKMLNRGRLPFCALPCDGMEESGVYDAIQRRLSGEEIPPLSGVRREVNDLVMKLCRFDRRDRFRKPSDVAELAEKLLYKLF